MHSETPGDAEEPADKQVESGRSPAEPRVPLTRRSFLKGAAVAGVAVSVAGMAYWDVATPAPSPRPTSSPPPTASPSPAANAQPAPQPSPVPAERFVSRPDLWSPIVSVSSTALELASGLILLTPRSGPGPIIVDDAGTPVWIRPISGKQTLNLRVGTYRGKPVLTWWEGTITRGTGQGEYVIIDQSYREIARVQAQNGLQGDLHEFILTAQGSALFSVYAERPVPPADAGSLPTPPPSLSPSPGTSGLPLPAVLESLVQEVDVASGRLLFDWHSLDHVALDESYAIAPNDQSFDYFHINSVDVEPDGNLLISARHTCALYKIDRRSGAVIWRLGGKRSDFEMGPGTTFLWQHDARRQPDGTITVFDDGSNGKNPPTEPYSRGLRLAVDESAMTVTLLDAYSHPPILAKSQGSTQLFDNGNVFVGWGDQPNFTEFRSDGAIALDGSLPAGASSYRALRFDWAGRGEGAPAVATAPFGSGMTMVYVSWNGATNVAQWAVLGGDSPGALRELARRRRAGFETAIPLSDEARYVAVRAIDAAGRTLAESAAIQVSSSTARGSAGPAA